MGGNSAEIWLEARGLDLESASRIGIVCQNDKVLFEYRDRAGAIAFRKVRPIAEKRFYMDREGAVMQLFGIDRLPTAKPRSFIEEPLIITEGELDCCAVSQSVPGSFAVSVPTGASAKKSTDDIVIATDTGFKFLWGSDGKLLPELDQFRKIVLATDDDDVGIILRDELAVRLGQSRCWWVQFPKGCKDANDVLLKYGADHLSEVVRNAKPIRPGRLMKFSEIPPEPNVVSYSTGWPIDGNLRVVRPELMIVSGRPNFGKSTWVRALCGHLAIAHGWRTAMLSPEEPAHRARKYLRRFATRVAGQRGEQAVADWLDKHFRVSSPPEDDPILLEFLLSEIESAALVHNAQAFICDPWNEIEHAFSRNRETETDYTAHVLTDLKRRARRYNMLLILVAHPKKMTEGVRPSLYDIAGSANWNNKADHGIIVDRPLGLNSDTVEVSIQKVKDFETMGGPPSSVWFKHDPQSADFIPIADPTTRPADEGPRRNGFAGHYE